MLTKKISAVIACYKDEKSILPMHGRITKTLTNITNNYEIIFVNDASPDNAEAVLRELAARDPLVKVIIHTRNFGSQAAFSSGMDLATGDAIIFLDGDLQDPPEIIENFVKKWQEGYDVVYGIRKKRRDKILRRIAYKIFYRLFRKLAYIEIPLDAGDFSLIDRKVAEVLKRFPERDCFLRGLRSWVGFKQTGVEYIRAERMFGQSTNTFFDNIRWAKKGIFSFSYLPLEFISFLGIFIVGVSFLGIIVQVILRFLLPDTPRGISTVIIIILFLGGIQLLCLSIIGEYIGKVFEETKQRPKYIVKETINDKPLKNKII